MAGAQKPRTVGSNGYLQSKEDPKVYTRQLSLAEVPMVHAINAPRPFAREPVRIHIFADVNIPASPSHAILALKSAWSALRMQEPDIATTFNAETMEKVYEVVDSDGEQKWLDWTFLVSTEHTNVAEVVRMEQQRTELLPVCRIIPSRGSVVEDQPNSSFKATILLLFSHWRTEASGVYMLLDRLLTTAIEHLAADPTTPSLKPEPGSELPRLTPTPESMLNLPTTTPPETSTRIRTRIANHATKLPSIELPTIAPPSTPTGPVQVHRLVFTPSATSTFLTACKAASPSISITSATLAAYLLAIWPLLPSNNSKNFASVMPAQIRSRLPSSTNLATGSNRNEIYKHMGCWNAAQFLLLSSPMPRAAANTAGGPGSQPDNNDNNNNNSFIDRAHDLNKQMSLANDPKWLSEEYVESALQINDLLAKIPAGSGAAPWFTSLGDLERGKLLRREYIAAAAAAAAAFSSSSSSKEGEVVGKEEEKKIELGQVYGWADPVGMGIVLTVWTWQGKMNWQIQWNGAYHEREMVKRIFDGMRELLELPVVVVVGSDGGSTGLGIGKGQMVVEEVVEDEY